MNAKLIVEGQEFDIEILDPKLQELIAPPKKKTGYERVENGGHYWIDDLHAMMPNREDGNVEDKSLYDIANYYSAKIVAENNARADKLMRQLRRFAVEHRKDDLRRADSNTGKYIIKYDAYNHQFIEGAWIAIPPAGSVYFDSEATAQLAIETFHDELIWYFTEYKDSL